MTNFSEKAVDALPARGGFAARAYERVKTALLTGEFDADEWIQIDEIAAQLQMSRHPVMDALKRLSIEGLVEIIPQVGCRPRKPSPQEIDDFMEVFAECEALLAGLAAERADHDEVVRMQLLSAQLGGLGKRAAQLNSLPEMYRDLNRRFHKAIRRGAKSPAVSEIVDCLSDRADFFLRFSPMKDAPIDFDASYASHERILDAIFDRDAEAARTAMKQHVLSFEHRAADHAMEGLPKRRKA